MPPPPRIAVIQALENYVRAGAAQPQETEQNYGTMLRDCSHDPLNCERIQQLLLATADMVGQTRTCPGYGAAGTCALAAHAILVRHLVIPNQNSDIIG